MPARPCPGGSGRGGSRWRCKLRCSPGEEMGESAERRRLLETKRRKSCRRARAGRCTTSAAHRRAARRRRGLLWGWAWSRVTQRAAAEEWIVHDYCNGGIWLGGCEGRGVNPVCRPEALGSPHALERSLMRQRAHPQQHSNGMASSSLSCFRALCRGGRYCCGAAGVSREIAIRADGWLQVPVVWSSSRPRVCISSARWLVHRHRHRHRLL